MALYLIERQFAERLEFNREGVARILSVNDDIGLRWLYSFLSADKKKTYCLYEAPSPEALREHAKQLGIPADAIVEVDQIRPEAYVQ